MYNASKWAALLLPVLLSLIILIEGKRYQFPPSITLEDGQKFDYIVVGAGAGGAAAAGRLALSGQDVLLVEVGGDPTYFSKIPAAKLALLGSSIDWQYKTIPNNISCLSSIDQQCIFNSGKCLGGSTSINYMLYTRGNRQKDFNITRPGWTFEDLMPYFLRSEALQDLDQLPPSSKPYHNTDGILKIGFFGYPKNPWHSRLIESYESLQFPFNADVNAKSEIGVTKVINYIYKKERMSTARGYLTKEDVKKILKVAKKTKCTGVILDVDNVARGINVVQESRQLKLFAQKEIILSAGAIGTPQILMLSGIGPAEHLKTMDIPVKVDLPVGDGLSDHILPLLIMQVDKNLEILEQTEIRKQTEAITLTPTEQIEYLIAKENASSDLSDVTIFANTHCYDFENRKLLNVSSDGSNCDVPNLQVINAFIAKNTLPLVKPLFQKSSNLMSYIVDQISDANRYNPLISVSPVLLNPRSLGTVRLKSKDPLQPPAIYPNYLGDERDIDEMLRSIRIIEQLADTPLFKQNNASLLKLNLTGCPDYEVNKQEYWRCYIRHMTHSVYHSVGTVSINTMLDERLRVLGVQRLRVADLSVLPTTPRANTEAVTVAIGERVAEIILEDNKKIKNV